MEEMILQRRNETVAERKYFSVLGDSVSTLDGYSQPKEAVYYEGYHQWQAQVYFPQDTWWGQVIEGLGGALLRNHSISGSMVSKHPQCEVPSYACSEERMDSLGVDACHPDVILIFMGINDWGWGVKITPQTEEETHDLSVFSVAYERMLRGLRDRYPSAALWCMTLPTAASRGSGASIFPYGYGGIHIGRYSDAIRDCAMRFGCLVIDLEKACEPYDTADGVHPNAVGMRTIAEAVLRCAAERGGA